ncbi:hypothetical protein CVIRNUC_011069 [Coccomyxa viridis]|uniref:Uncharacterized protein n=1 Tax=Coccomyxa viridis TaxID=1274662 RepID=A0AAV1IKQ0_9CHLO|nr:hypothetical protein CVIRNUC_011069 [Coccomyxa viridis]
MSTSPASNTCPLRSIFFTEVNTPNLVTLSIAGQDAAEAFNVSLVELTHLDIYRVQLLDPRGFGPSLSACPKLEHFWCYKLWGLGLHNSSMHKLSLPMCAVLTLCRLDELSEIEIEAPKLDRLDLEACCLDHVRLAAGPGPQVKVIIGGACIDAASEDHLTEHPRVGRHNLIREFEDL